MRWLLSRSRRIEPRVSVVRFNRAALRLEVLGGVKDAPNRLMLRMLRRFGAVVIEDDVLRVATRFTDLGPSR